MKLLRALLPALALAFSLTACKTSHPQSTAATPEYEQPVDRAEDRHDDHEFVGRQVVRNYEATIGDVTICPYSGRKFEVEVDSPRLKWKGMSWVLCPDEPMDEIQANPDKYLGEYLDDTPAGLDMPKD